ncbi:hypothetical protein PC129_g19834 [Phytophthora cactorum]|uniref:Uncharacterized protein n=1 Tax=Phytophthora cactorum TaxID=29920 RepID=A0A8T1HAR1_9STRA|nr:hypothetical protein Pcac1_g16082 [Phytophthora cactorum]KAG2796840.1 hypothetical protein PC112_g22041 [Phytophthora cactorum]KAG2875761.1 hypothetical protein PC114_g24545 [Phytophthora cactorum]KAG2891274.1 hypothetical protein PC117_g24284 [Phytophthora cactorum]KAG2968856.1 hypothetical protein PC119_g24117 [Phytophthora cactorum]
MAELLDESTVAVMVQLLDKSAEVELTELLPRQNWLDC